MTLNDGKIVLAGNNNNNVEQMNKRCCICQDCKQSCELISLVRL